MKRSGGQRPGASQEQTTPPLFSAPGENLIMEPTPGKAEGEKTRLEEETSPDKVKGTLS